MRIKNNIVGREQELRTLIEGQCFLWSSSLWIKFATTEVKDGISLTFCGALESPYDTALMESKQIVAPVIVEAAIEQYGVDLQLEDEDFEEEEDDE